MREGGTQRTVFKMSVKLSKLEARMDYEAAEAAPLALLSMEAVHFDLAIHPSTMKLTASLGNLRGQDGQLPEVRGLGEGFERVLHVAGWAACGLCRSYRQLPAVGRGIRLRIFGHVVCGGYGGLREVGTCRRWVVIWGLLSALEGF